MITVFFLLMVVIAVGVGLMFAMRKGADSQRGEVRPPQPTAAPEKRTPGLY